MGWGCPNLKGSHNRGSEHGQCDVMFVASRFLSRVSEVATLAMSRVSEVARVFDDTETIQVCQY